MDIQGILFDKDGTIADFDVTFLPATRKVLEELAEGSDVMLHRLAKSVGFDLEGNAISNDSIIIAGSGYEITEALAAVLGRTDVAELSIHLDRRFGEVCMETVVAISGVTQAIEKLHSSGIKLAVATNDAEANAVSQMRQLGIENCFTKILGADSGHGAKPGSGMIDAFVEQTGLSPNNLLMVGDSTHDLHAGRAAGVVTCGVLTGPALREELEPFADHILESAADLPQFLAAT